MKEKLKRFFNSDMLTLIGIIFGGVLTFEFIVFPGLTQANTIVNLISTLIGIVTVLLVLYLIPSYFIKMRGIFESSPDHIEPGETELDYIPKDDIIKKKPVKKKVTKPEFPMLPHHAKKEKVASKPLKPKNK